MDPIPQSLAGVGLTAVGVALIRANESMRPDRLFDDPYAQLFADAAGSDFLGPGAPPEAEQRWTQMLDLVDRFHDGRVVATRYFDDYLLSAVAAGCSQVVNIGAGLDIRSLRLPLSEDLPFYELDQPAMFEFKERVLAGHTAARSRVIVPTDLSANWFLDLTRAGFDSTLPTAWLEEGVLAYLAPAVATDVLDTVTRVSVQGSRLAKTAMSAPRSDNETYQRMRAFVGESATPSAGVSGVDRENAYRLAEQGWQIATDAHLDLATRYGRPIADATSAMTGSEYVCATRR